MFSEGVDRGQWHELANRLFNTITWANTWGFQMLQANKKVCYWLSLLPGSWRLILVTVKRLLANVAVAVHQNGLPVSKTIWLKCSMRSCEHFLWFRNKTFLRVVNTYIVNKKSKTFTSLYNHNTKSQCHCYFNLFELVANRNTCLSITITSWKFYQDIKSMFCDWCEELRMNQYANVNEPSIFPQNMGTSLTNVLNLRPGIRFFHKIF